ncbi:MAG: trypsin-like peptidase domain-containing protein [Myxococcales bacterium]|nr:trypsin-like peptidase domain-containing protein [Myxococcales bacterium]
MNSKPPDPYCQGRWKETIGALTLTAMVVLGISVHNWSSTPPALASASPSLARPGAPLSASANAASPRIGGATLAMTTPAAPAQGVAAQGWSGGSPPGAGPLADPNVRWIGQAQRTSFGAAATQIRPAVLGIRARMPSGLERIGSGVVIDPRGYAITCHHVIAGATQIDAHRFRQGNRHLPAEVIASDGDLAVLRISDPSPFSVATLAPPPAVGVGEWVLAVGHPFGFGLTVTAGIVGRRHASLTVPNGATYADLMQTDAPINEGSSGGPLVDVQGRIVGINAAIYAPTGVFSGTGFAIPVERVRALLARALPASGPPQPLAQAQPSSGGRAYALGPGAQASWGAGGAPPTPPSSSAPRGWFGLGLADLDPTLIQELGYPLGGGVVVDRVVPGSPAEAARLVRGDVLVAIGDRPIADLRSIRATLQSVSADQALTFQVWRQGRTHTLILHSRLAPVG